MLTLEEEQHKPCETKDNDEPNSRDGSFEDIDVNGHEGSCEDDDDRDSVDTPCSCEDMHCTRKYRQNSWSVRKNGDCGYVGKPWPSEKESRNGTSVDLSCHVNGRDEEEEEFCSDCMSASLTKSNGGKKKKGKKKKKRGAKIEDSCDKVNTLLLMLLFKVR